MWQRYRREVMRRQSVIDLKGWRFGSAARNYLIQRRRSRFPSITLKHFDVLKVVMWFKGREGVLNFSLHTADRAFPPPVIRRMRLKPSQDTSYCIITLFLSASLSRTLPVSRLYFCSLASSFSNFFHILSLVFFLFCLFALTPEPPQFIKEPEKHITAEMEKVVDIPCQARGELCVFMCAY